jgi:hypothetical protein
MRVLSTRVAAAALGVALVLGAATPAAADGGGDRGASTTTVVTTTTPRVGSAAARHRWQRYQRSLAAIDQSFIASVARAEATFRHDLRRARSTADQLVARAVLRQALAQASADREVELERLGDPPERPAHTDHTDHTDHVERARGQAVRATAAVK